jgi:redox-sensing transcriptional repressor
MDDIDSVVETEGVDLAIVAVPAAAVADVTQRLEIAGVAGILNFAPAVIPRRSSSIAVVNVDLAAELQRLAFVVLQSREVGES